MFSSSGPPWLTGSITKLTIEGRLTQSSPGFLDALPNSTYCIFSDCQACRNSRACSRPRPGADVLAKGAAIMTLTDVTDTDV